MLATFKKDRYIDQVIHKLALDAVQRHISTDEAGIELYDDGGYFSELKAFKKNKLSEKVGVANKTVLFHTLRKDNLSNALKISDGASKLVILFHNAASVDSFFAHAAAVLSLAKDQTNQYYSKRVLLQELEDRKYMVISDEGSFFASKYILIFFPNDLVKLLEPAIKWLEHTFAKTAFKSLMRNRVLVAVPYYQNQPVKKFINSKYAQMSLRFDELYNKATPHGKAYFRNVQKLFSLMKVSEKDTLLDIGIGTGTYSIEAALKGAKVTGFDISQEMLKLAKDKIDSLNLKINLIQGDAEKLPFKNNSFSKIVTASVPHDVDNFEKFFSEMARVLKPKGSIYINIYNPYTVAGLVLWAKIRLGMHPKVNVLPITYVDTIAASYGLKRKKVIGIELLQGLPLPANLKWWLVATFNTIEDALSRSSLRRLFSQYIIEYKKND